MPPIPTPTSTPHECFEAAAERNFHLRVILMMLSDCAENEKGSPNDMKPNERRDPGGSGLFAFAPSKVFVNRFLFWSCIFLVSTACNPFEIIFHFSICYGFSSGSYGLVGGLSGLSFVLICLVRLINDVCAAKQTRQLSAREYNRHPVTFERGVELILSGASPSLPPRWGCFIMQRLNS